MRQLILLAAAGCLAACTTANASIPSVSHLPPSSSGGTWSTLPSSVVVDDQLGTSVELGYQAASLAERTAVKAGLVSPSQARTLMAYDNQAYEAVCETRTAYDVANGNDPLARKDLCAPVTKQGKLVSYAQAAQSAMEMIRLLVGSTQQSLAVNQH